MPGEHCPSSLESPSPRRPSEQKERTFGADGTGLRGGDGVCIPGRPGEETEEDRANTEGTSQLQGSKCGTEPPSREPTESERCGDMIQAQVGWIHSLHIQESQSMKLTHRKHWTTPRSQAKARCPQSLFDAVMECGLGPKMSQR